MLVLSSQYWSENRPAKQNCPGFVLLEIKMSVNPLKQLWITAAGCTRTACLQVFFCYVKYFSSYSFSRQPGSRTVGSCSFLACVCECMFCRLHMYTVLFMLKYDVIEARVYVWVHHRAVRLPVDSAMWMQEQQYQPGERLVSCPWQQASLWQMVNNLW